MKRFVNFNTFLPDGLHKFSLSASLLLIYIQYKDVWFHSHREGVTKRPYALTEDQRTNLVHFLRAAMPEDTLLPILGNENNRRRVDAEIAIPEHSIYRDRWERKIERYDYGHYRRMRRDVIDVIDYPESARHYSVDP